MSAVLPSTAAQRSLRGARRWARVAAVMTLVPCLPMGVFLPWMLLSMRADARPKALAFGIMLVIANPLAILALVHASRLGRFVRGDRATAAGAFRLLRVMMIVGAVAYAILVIDELVRF